MKALYLVMTLMIFSCSTTSLKKNNKMNEEQMLISIQKTPCRGKCATYKLTINQDHEVIYRNAQNVPVEEDRTFKLTDEQFKQLKNKLETYSFEKYSPSYGGVYMDASQTIIKARNKTIQLVRKKGPPELYDLVKFIEENYRPSK